MTNREYFLSLDKDSQDRALDTYRNHPLNKYIDWDSFFESEDGNEMHFVRGERIIHEDLGECIVLEEDVQNDEDCILVYSIGDNSFVRTTRCI